MSSLSVLLLNTAMLLIISGCNTGKERPSPTDPQVQSYSLHQTDRYITIFFPEYTITIQYGEPFGIRSLQLKGQPGDFVHPTLPVGDWEWFWFDDDSSADKRASIKLIQPDWVPPTVEERDDTIVLKFSRPNAIHPGITLGVEYQLRVLEPAFDITYSIHNSSGATLENPYVMIGFPGFTDHAWISSVASAEGLRQPTPPYANFLDEALAVGKAEYTLLRDDVNLQASYGRFLKGIVGISALGANYLLQAAYLPDAFLNQIHTAHVNKPDYLTSHLYAFLKNIPDGETRGITIYYLLSRI